MAPLSAEQAIILAGYGEQMYPMVDGTPKALIPIANQPMISHVLQWLEEGGISEILVVVPSEVESKVANYLTKVYEVSASNIRVEWSVVDAYGTAEALRIVRDKIKVCDRRVKCTRFGC